MPASDPIRDLINKMTFESMQNGAMPMSKATEPTQEFDAQGVPDDAPDYYMGRAFEIAKKYNATSFAEGLAVEIRELIEEAFEHSDAATAATAPGPIGKSFVPSRSETIAMALIGWAREFCEGTEAQRRLEAPGVGINTSNLVFDLRHAAAHIRELASRGEP